MKINKLVQIEELLRLSSKARTGRFTGFGLIFYNDLAMLPYLPLATGVDSSTAIETFEGLDLLSVLELTCQTDSPYHDGFHFVDIETMAVTHISQFISPPIPQTSLDRFKGTGARQMSAVLASIIPGVLCVGLASQKGDVQLFMDGIDIAKEN